MFKAYCMGNWAWQLSNLCFSWGYERLQKSKDSLMAGFENVNIVLWPSRTSRLIWVLAGRYVKKICDFVMHRDLIFVTRHAKRYELGGRRHFEKIRLKVNVTTRKNSTPKSISKRSLTYYRIGSKAFFMLRFSATRLSNILYNIKCSLLNVRKLKFGRESSTQFSLW